jgi:hypothetical protein
VVLFSFSHFPGKSRALVGPKVWLDECI